MTLHPAYDALRKHRIRFVSNTREWKDDCFDCGNKNCLSVHYDDDVAEFRCEACGRNGSERLRPPSAPTDGGNGEPEPARKAEPEPEPEPKAPTIEDATALRRALVAAGYLPIPLYGKEPPIYGKNNTRKGLPGWSDIASVTDEMIDMWAKTWPDAVNTGILTRAVPALDLDILNEEAVRACEDLVRERYEEAAFVLVRIGLPPKRAILFRTDEPFDKITANLIAPNGSQGQKIELLANGQQVVVAGIHPDTGKPYRWYGGEPGAVKRSDLPSVRAAEAQKLVDDLIELLVRDFGYQRAPGRPSKDRPTGNGGEPGGSGGADDWQYLLDNIQAGRELHDSLRDLAAKLVKAGMNGGAAVNFLRAEMERSSAPHDERWRERNDEIPRLVRSAEERFRQDELPPKELPPKPQPRARVQAPGKYDEWIPVMDKINEVLGASTAPEPPTRDIDGFMNYARKLVLPGLHLFTTANEQDGTADILPAPEQWLLRRLGVVEVAELIERHINYIGAKGKSVHLHTEFVKHYVQRDDGILPFAFAISTLPLVLGDGALLAPVGLDHKRKIIFKVPHQLHNILPRREECTDGAVRKAMKYLTETWLVDVSTNYTGKCILIVAALTMIERSLLPERPAFFVTAGKSRGGKTTLLKMLIMAVTGQLAAAAAWTDDDNERKKALISYLLAGVAYILWDNIPRGEKISCPHIERACTADFYSDRRLGVSEIITAAASAIQLFTGNNVGPRGDLASRTLELRIDVNRPDPENRKFEHPDPIGWTEENRAEILTSLYTILLGNPMLDRPRDEAGGTRFKVWYRLVGSAVEHAARLVKKEAADPVKRETADQETREKMDRIAAQPDVDFQKVFLAQEIESDEDTNTLLEALLIMERRWPVIEFLGSDIAKLINREGDTSELDNEYEMNQFETKRDAGVLRDALYPDAKGSVVATARGVGKRLKDHVDEPVQDGNETLTLRARLVDGTNNFRVVRQPKEEK